jgi:hypothetical protein
MSRPDALTRRIRASRTLAEHGANLFERIAAAAAVHRLERAQSMNALGTVTTKRGRFPVCHRRQALIAQSAPCRFNRRERDFLADMRHAENPTRKQLAWLKALHDRALEATHEPA